MSDGFRPPFRRAPAAKRETGQAELEEKTTLTDDAAKGARTLREKCKVGCGGSERRDSFGDGRGHG